MVEYDVIVIGGGLSGLSAAVELSAAGRRVLLLEQNRYCGGRTYSFADKTTGDTVDNGQHLMMGCYHAARRYMHLIGTEHLASLQTSLQINFLHPSRNPFSFICPKLPAPLHLIRGLYDFKAISLADRLKMLRVTMGLINSSPSKNRKLDKLTVEEWLIKLGQSNINRKYLWDVLTIGALNNYPQNISALMLFRVLRAAFFRRQENASLLIPHTGLSELFIDPAVQFIEASGGKVLTNLGVKSLICDGTHVYSVLTMNDDKLSAKSFISAVPWYTFEGIKPRCHSGLLSKLNDQSRFRSSPIISIHLWLNREITDLDFAALIGTRVQWMFNKSRLLKREKISNGKVKQQYLSLVISGAQEFIEMSKEQLVKIAMEDLRRVLSNAQNARVLHSLVIKEKRATFLPAPGLETFRPGTQTEFDNLFLAGDWTATGYPATIEGAVMSGRKAAELVLGKM